MLALRKDLIASAVAVVFCTALFGLAYPLLATGVAQILFPNKSDGSQVDRDGRVVGSRLIAQDFRGDRRYFQPRPSQTDYSANVTAFANQGPNQRELYDLTKKRIKAYLSRERPYTPGLTTTRIPVDAVTNSGSGVDPHISEANARFQANRVARLRHAPLPRVRKLIDDATDGRFLGFLGEPGVNVLELNLALDREFQRR
jgi:potassium-transporting ATPase KdpC subunit